MFLRLQPRIGFAWTCRTLGFISFAASILSLIGLNYAPKKTSRPKKLLDLSAFREPVFVCLCCGGFLNFLAYWIPLFYLSTYALDGLGASRELSLYMAAILNAGSLLGRLLPSLIAPRTGAQPLAMMANICALIIVFCWTAVSSIAGFIVWAIAFGFFMGIIISSNPAAAAHPTVSPLHLYGTRFGIICVFAAIGSVIGTPIAGALVQQPHGSFLRAQLFAGFIMLGGACLRVWPTITYIRYERRQRFVSEQV